MAWNSLKQHYVRIGTFCSWAPPTVVECNSRSRHCCVYTSHSLSPSGTAVHMWILRFISWRIWNSRSQKKDHVNWRGRVIIPGFYTNMMHSFIDCNIRDEHERNKKNKSLSLLKYLKFSDHTLCLLSIWMWSLCVIDMILTHNKHWAV